MKRFKNILCYYCKTDGTAGLDRAIGLAKKNRAELTIVEVIEPLPHKYTIGKLQLFKELHQKTLSEAQGYLDEVLHPLSEKNNKIQGKVLEGIPALEIIKEVLRNDHDLVVKTAQAKNKIQETFFGTTTRQLLRKCPCPVWVIKSTQKKSFNRIVAAVDPDPSDKKKTALNIKIIEIASSLAKMENSLLDIVHCWSQYPDVLLGRGYLQLPQKQINNVLKEAKMVHKEWLDKMIHSLHLSHGQYKVRLLTGNAADEIKTFVKEQGVDLIVMGTVSRTGVSGLLIGNTAEKVIDQVKCSILTVKPDKFVSPVILNN